MRIVVFTIGTQGDVRPFVALGCGLKDLGHEVCIASGETCRILVESHGLNFSPLTADFLELMASDPSAMKKGLNPFALVGSIRKHLRVMAKDWAVQAQLAAVGAELIIANGMVALLGASIAELLDVPCVETQLQPVTPCPDIPPMMLSPGSKPLPGKINVALYQVMRGVTWLMLGPAYRLLRKELALPAYPRIGPYYQKQSRERRRLLAYSPKLLPPSPFWPEHIKVIGHFHLQEANAWQPDKTLSDFLETGSKPIYIGFGSMVGDEREALSRIIEQAIELSGQRAIVATGWGGLEMHSSERVLVLNSAPHDWLFPRVSLAVHHGGAGTTAAASRAGIPSVVIPFFGDQPFWAWCLQQRGVAPSALSRKTLMAEDLAAAITEALSPAMQVAARNLAADLADEDGVSSAILQLKAWSYVPADPQPEMGNMSPNCHEVAV